MIPVRQPWADPVEDISPLAHCPTCELWLRPDQSCLHIRPAVTLRPQPSLRQAIVNLKAAVEARNEYHAAGSPDCDCERINNNEWRARADFFAACEREGIERELVLILPEIV